MDRTAVIDRLIGPRAVAIIGASGDLSRINGRPMKHLMEKGYAGAILPVNPKYEDPYPLSSKYFLCSRMTGEGERMGIYLVDVFGNEVLLHVEGAGCFDPMPLAPRARPSVIPDRAQVAETSVLADAVDHRFNGHQVAVHQRMRQAARHLRSVVP